ncbi:hypothetical protein V7111_26895 [Neobacillus niacini]
MSRVSSTGFIECMENKWEYKNNGKLATEQARPDSWVSEAQI